MGFVIFWLTSRNAVYAELQVRRVCPLYIMRSTTVFIRQRFPCYFFFLSPKEDNNMDIYVTTYNYLWKSWLPLSQEDRGKTHPYTICQICGQALNSQPCFCNSCSQIVACKKCDKRWQQMKNNRCSMCRNPMTAQRGQPLISDGAVACVSSDNKPYL